ncbi:MAG: AraC family transcriptional regulator ligand-binding domain-containing protein [Marinobacter sp.]
MDISNRMALEVPLISARYARRFIEFMERRGVKRAALLNDTDITEDVLNDPDASICMQQITSVLQKADWLMNDERAAFQFGQQLDLPSHGLLGFAVLGQDNPRQLISMIVQYLRVGLPLMDMELNSTGSTFHIRLLDTWGLGELSPCVTKMYMGSIHRISAEVCGHFDIQFAFPARRDASSWQSLASDCEFRFDAPCNQITMALKGQPTQKNNTSLKFLLARNRKNSGETVGLADETLMQVREMIMSQPGRPCTTSNIARRLDISTRTLRQHLASAGTSFREVRSDIRENFASLYLNDTNVPLDSIAEKLGFSDQASFTKAYRAWTGQTPGDVRRQSRKTP